MKVAYTAWSWLQDEYNNWGPVSHLPKRDFEQSLRDLKDCGYEYMENFNIVSEIYENDREEFDEVMKTWSLFVFITILLTISKRIWLLLNGVSGLQRNMVLYL